MFMKRRFVIATTLAVAAFAGACSSADSAGGSPTAASATGSQASASNQAGLTAAQSAALSAACGPLGTGDGTVTNGTPPGTPPPGAVIGGPGGLGPGDTVTTGTPPSGPEPDAQLAVTGAVEGLAGSCPSISFTVHGKTVRTKATTAFGGGACSSLKSGDRIGAMGTFQADGSILASCVASGI